MNNIKQSAPKAYPCPQCQGTALWLDNPFKPFCSERCKLIDLGAWADETYRMPSIEPADHQDFDQF